MRVKLSGRLDRSVPGTCAGRPIAKHYLELVCTNGQRREKLPAFLEGRKLVFSTELRRFAGVLWCGYQHLFETDENSVFVRMDREWGLSLCDWDLCGVL